MVDVRWLITGQKKEASKDIPKGDSELIAIIREQAEEIGQLKEQVRQLTIEKERLASNARLPDTANAG